MIEKTYISDIKNIKYYIIKLIDIYFVKNKNDLNIVIKIIDIIDDVNFLNKIYFIFKYAINIFENIDKTIFVDEVEFSITIIFLLIILSLTNMKFEKQNIDSFIQEYCFKFKFKYDLIISFIILGNNESIKFSQELIEFYEEY